MVTIQRHAKRVATGITGGLIVLVGIIAIPYPGPGWLIVFAGLATLATEFSWAQRVLDVARARYDHWVEWLKRQNLAIRLLVLSFTGVVVILTIWLFNGYGLINDWLNLGQDWVGSPLSK